MASSKSKSVAAGKTEDPGKTEEENELQNVPKLLDIIFSKETPSDEVSHLVTIADLVTEKEQFVKILNDNNFTEKLDKTIDRLTRNSIGKVSTVWLRELLNLVNDLCSETSEMCQSVIRADQSITCLLTRFVTEVKNMNERELSHALELMDTLLTIEENVSAEPEESTIRWHECLFECSYESFISRVVGLVFSDHGTDSNVSQLATIVLKVEEEETFEEVMKRLETNQFSEKVDKLLHEYLETSPDEKTTLKLCNLLNFIRSACDRSSETCRLLFSKNLHHSMAKIFNELVTGKDDKTTDEEMSQICDLVGILLLIREETLENFPGSDEEWNDAVFDIPGETFISRLLGIIFSDDGSSENVTQLWSIADLASEKKSFESFMQGLETNKFFENVNELLHTDVKDLLSDTSDEKLCQLLNFIYSACGRSPETCRLIFSKKLHHSMANLFNELVTGKDDETTDEEMSQICDIVGILLLIREETLENFPGSDEEWNDAVFDIPGETFISRLLGIIFSDDGSSENVTQLWSIADLASEKKSFESIMQGLETNKFFENVNELLHTDVKDLLSDTSDEKLCQLLNFIYSACGRSPETCRLIFSKKLHHSMANLFNELVTGKDDETTDEEMSQICDIVGILLLIREETLENFPGSDEEWNDAVFDIPGETFISRLLGIIFSDDGSSENVTQLWSIADLASEKKSFESIMQGLETNKFFENVNELLHTDVKDLLSDTSDEKLCQLLNFIYSACGRSPETCRLIFSKKLHHSMANLFNELVTGKDDETTDEEMSQICDIVGILLLIREETLENFPGSDEEWNDAVFDIPGETFISRLLGIIFSDDGSSENVTQLWSIADLASEKKSFESIMQGLETNKFFENVNELLHTDVKDLLSDTSDEKLCQLLNFIYSACGRSPETCRLIFSKKLHHSMANLFNELVTGKDDETTDEEMSQICDIVETLLLIREETLENFPGSDEEWNDADAVFDIPHKTFISRLLKVIFGDDGTPENVSQLWTIGSFTAEVDSFESFIKHLKTNKFSENVDQLLLASVEDQIESTSNLKLCELLNVIKLMCVESKETCKLVISKGLHSTIGKKIKACVRKLNLSDINGFNNTSEILRCMFKIKSETLKHFPEYKKHWRNVGIPLLENLLIPKCLDFIFQEAGSDSLVSQLRAIANHAFEEDQLEDFVEILVQNKYLENLDKLIQKPVESPALSNSNSKLLKLISFTALLCRWSSRICTLFISKDLHQSVVKVLTSLSNPVSKETPRLKNFPEFVQSYTKVICANLENFPQSKQNWRDAGIVKVADSLLGTDNEELKEAVLMLLVHVGDISSSRKTIETMVQNVE